MTVFIADIHISGHHLTYIRLFARLFQKLGYKVVVLLPISASKEIDEAILSNNNPFIHVSFFEYSYEQVGIGRIAGRNDILRKWKVVAESIRENIHQVQGTLFVFFPYLDPFIGPYVTVKEFDSIFSYRWSGLYMNPPNCRVPQSFRWLRKGVLSFHNLLRSKNCKTIFVYDPLCAELLSLETKTQVLTIPDIIDESTPNLSFDPIKKIKEKAGSRKIISLLGSVSKRKGLLLLLKTVTSLREDFFVVIAGKLDQSSFDTSEIQFIQTVIQQNDEHLYFYNERIPSESDFNALVDISDVLFAVYQNFYTSSNLISKAAYFRKPIIVSKGFLMEEIVNKYELGISIESNNSELLIVSLKEMISDTYINGYQKRNRCAEYCSQFSDKNLSSLLEMLN